MSQKKYFCRNKSAKIALIGRKSLKEALKGNMNRTVKPNIAKELQQKKERQKRKEKALKFVSSYIVYILHKK